MKKAVELGEGMAKKIGYAGFKATDSADQKVEALYRMLVHHKIVQPLAKDQENLLGMKHKLALWIAKRLPEGHELLKKLINATSLTP